MPALKTAPAVTYSKGKTMVKTILYTTVLSDSGESGCDEKLQKCEATSHYHVCFDDGSGEYVCQSCFTQRANGGYWITDSTEVLAS
jgi:hypothetical protein